MSNKTNLSNENRGNRRRRRHAPSARGISAPPTDSRHGGLAPAQERPKTPKQKFNTIAQTKRIAEPMQDGSLRVLVQPQRRREFDWHKPNVFVPESQWRPTTGITRYEFARRTTPDHQQPLFRHLQRLYQVEGPPAIAPDELWEPVRRARAKGGSLTNGLPGEEMTQEFFDELSKYVVREHSPDGQWSFAFQAVRMGDGIADRLDVKHCDYRTVADWTLLMRFRSWVLPDDRNAFMLMPIVDIHEPGWEKHYENDTPNNLQLISPRDDEAGA